MREGKDYDKAKDRNLYAELRKFNLGSGEESMIF